MGILRNIAAAFQFLTRLPMGWLPYRPDALSRSAAYFPLVGLAVGAASAGIYWALAPHLPAQLAALAVVLFTVLVTGGLHEDGLADTADAFGGGHGKEKILAILRDSRIGSYGALAIVFSVVGRTLLLAALPAAGALKYIVAAEVLSRWTVLPLGAALPAARENEGQGARLARHISAASVALGTLLACGIVGFALRTAVWMPLAAACAVVLCFGLYCKRRIGGVTGDCFGAAIQLTSIAVYLCGVWHR
jgi:adenosylcobinamide-GDP ribazoletransferase